MNYADMLNALHEQEEQAALDYIEVCVSARGVPPSVRELASERGYASAETALKVLRRLEAKGLIERLPGTARGIIIKGSPMVADTEEM